MGVLLHIQLLPPSSANSSAPTSTSTSTSYGSSESAAESADVLTVSVYLSREDEAFAVGFQQQSRSTCSRLCAVPLHSRAAQSITDPLGGVWLAPGRKVMFLPAQDCKTSLSTPSRGELAIMTANKGAIIHIKGSKNGGMVIAPAVPAHKSGLGSGSETQTGLEWTCLKDGYAFDIQDACARSSEGVLLVKIDTHPERKRDAVKRVLHLHHHHQHPHSGPTSPSSSSGNGNTNARSGLGSGFDSDSSPDSGLHVKARHEHEDVVLCMSVDWSAPAPAPTSTYPYPSQDQTQVQAQTKDQFEVGGGPVLGPRYGDSEQFRKSNPAEENKNLNYNLPANDEIEGEKLRRYAGTLAVESGGYPDPSLYPYPNLNIHPDPYAYSASNPHPFPNPYPYPGQNGMEDRDYAYNSAQAAYIQASSSSNKDTNMYSSPRPAPPLPPASNAPVIIPAVNLSVPAPIQTQVTQSTPRRAQAEYRDTGMYYAPGPETRGITGVYGDGNSDTNDRDNAGTQADRASRVNYDAEVYGDRMRTRGNTTDNGWRGPDPDLNIQ